MVLSNVVFVVTVLSSSSVFSQACVQVSIYIYRLNLPDECVSTKLRVAVNHVCFHLVTQFYIYIYIYIYMLINT